jgi:hypothetical protein
MSELTYKKIIDVETVEALNDGATVFVNDGGAMKQVAANEFGLGTVKTVNGVAPDENGEVKATELIQFADYSAIMPGRILYGGTYTMQEIVNKLFNGEHQRYEVVISILNPMNGIRTDRKVTAYEQIVTGDDRLLTGVKLYYGDEACPIILDGVSNTITLDPDWVKPEENAGGSGGGYDFVIRSDGGAPYYWAKGNGLDFINRLIDGPSPLVCIHNTNRDHEYPSVQMYFPKEIAIASGSGKWCGITLNENASMIYIDMETGEIQND